VSRRQETGRNVQSRRGAAPRPERMLSGCRRRAAGARAPRNSRRFPERHQAVRACRDLAPGTGRGRGLGRSRPKVSASARPIWRPIQLQLLAELGQDTATGLQRSANWNRRKGNWPVASRSKSCLHCAGRFISKFTMAVQQHAMSQCQQQFPSPLV
jgi:hypothetical protein